MTPRRQQTTLPPANQPVRVYKYIALTFLVMTVAVFGVIILVSSKRALITIETRPEPIDASGTILVEKEESDESIRGMVTSTVVAMEKTFSPAGTREEDDIAKGTVVLRNETGVNQPLVATTRLLSPEGILFRMEKGAVVPANGTAAVAVYADKPGKSGNIGPTRFTIPGLSPSQQKVIYGVSDSPMQGGVKSVGIVSEQDIEKAEKQLLALMEEEAKKTLGAAYPQMVGVYTTVNETFAADTETGTTTDAFLMRGEARVVGVFVKEADMRAAAAALLTGRLEQDNELVQAGDELPAVTLEAYDEAAGTATLQAIVSGTATLNPESPELGKLMFFGKTADEVKRYVNSLERVHRVDVKLSPSWVQTVPHLAEQVKVVVKQVE